MARFETPNSRVAATLKDLDRQTARIAQSRVLSARLNHFVESYVEPDELELPIDGESHSFDYRRVSALGKAGTLLHVRLHSSPYLDVPGDLRNLVIIDSLASTDELEMWTAWSTEIPASAIRPAETVFDMGMIPEEDFVLREVANTGGEEQAADALELERMLHLEDLRDAAPQIRISNLGWTFRHANGMLEPLQDIGERLNKVNLGISRGLGRSALPAKPYTLDTELQPTGSDE